VTADGQNTRFGPSAGIASVLQVQDRARVKTKL
jgi:hypothetical protein